MKFTFGPETHPLPGYTIKRAIDRGAFGEVYYALSDSGKEVALKLLRDNPQIELRGVSQCLNLKHPNLVTLFDVRTDADGDSWVIMEYLAGDSLEQVLTDHPQGLSPSEVMQWVAGIADGITCLHDREIVHRDLKPANIFREGGIVKVGDVGLSKFMTPSRRSAQTESVGTVYYMAPEVARGKYGRELDVYSLAVLTYEMLTGSVPFQGESTAEILMKHLTSRPDLSRVPEPFRPVLERALEKDPHRRTSSVLRLTDEFRQALRVWQRGREPATEIPTESFVFAGSAAGTPLNGRLPNAALSTSHGTAQHKTWPTCGPAEHRTDRKTGQAKTGVPCGPFNKMWLWLVIPVGIIVMRASGRNGSFSSGRSWFTLLILGGAAYVTYLVVSTIVSRVLQPAAVPGNVPDPVGGGAGTGVLGRPGNLSTGQRMEVARPAASQPRRVFSGELLGPETLRRIPWQVRGQELFTSMSWAAFWTLVCTAVVAVALPALGIRSPNPAQDEGQLGLFGYTTLVAAWMILVISKLCEGTVVDPKRRRLFLALGGGVVGAAAWAIGKVLLVAPIQVPGQFPGMFRNVGQWELTTTLAPHNSPVPSLAGYLVFFGALFAIRRWWTHVDSFRWDSFRWSSWLLTAVAAWAIPAAFTFPQLWAVCWGAALSAVVQLSASRVAPNQRPALVNAGRGPG